MTASYKMADSPVGSSTWLCETWDLWVDLRYEVSNFCTNQWNQSAGLLLDGAVEKQCHARSSGYRHHHRKPLHACSPGLSFPLSWPTDVKVGSPIKGTLSVAQKCKKKVKITGVTLSTRNMISCLGCGLQSATYCFGPCVGRGKTLLSRREKEAAAVSSVRTSSPRRCQLDGGASSPLQRASGSLQSPVKPLR